MQLGTGGFQLRAVVQHGAGLSAAHKGMQLLGIVGCGGRLHGNKKLHVFSPRSFFVANVLGWVPGGMGAVYAPSSGIPQHTDGFLLYI